MLVLEVKFIFGWIIGTPLELWLTGLGIESFMILIASWRHSINRQGNWCWCPARSDDLVAIQSKLPEVPIGEIDKSVWTIARSDSYVWSDT
jgi:hypothetical protein